MPCPCPHPFVLLSLVPFEENERAERIASHLDNDYNDSTLSNGIGIFLSIKYGRSYIHSTRLYD